MKLFITKGNLAPESILFQRVETKQENKPKFPFLLVLLILIAATITWKEITKQKANGEWTLTEPFVEQVLNELEKTEVCETYVLTAASSGSYLCKHCPRGTYYLHAGEVYKYGMTCTQYSRYQSSWLAQMRLNYTVVFRGDLKTARAAEIKLLGKYPILPENLARPIDNRLALPPGNNAILK